MLKALIKNLCNPFCLLFYPAVLFILFSLLPLTYNGQLPFISAGAYAEQAADLPQWPHERSDLLPDPAVVFGKLANGFRYALMTNQNPKDRVSIHLDVQVGSMNEAGDEQGLAHFLEHLLFCGSTHFKPGELVKYFQSIGMDFGADANAHTGFFETVYDIFLPDGKPGSIEDAFVVIKDYAEGALLLQSEIDREQGVILSEKRTRDSSMYRTFVETINFELPDVKISKRLPIGKEKIIRNADKELLKGFYDSYYRPENMILVIVGDFKVDDVVLKINNTFSGLSPRGSEPPPIIWGKTDHRGVKAFYHEEKDVGSAESTIEVVRIIDEVPDSLLFQKYLLTKDIADRIVQNRIDAMIGKPGTPFVSASIGSGIYLQRVEYAEITAKSRPENWRKTLPFLEQTLRKVIKYGFVSSELERVKKDYMAALDAAAQKAPTRYSGAIAREFIRHVNGGKVFMSPGQKKEILSPMIREITLKQLHEAFKKTWSPDHRLVMLTGNAKISEGISDPKKEILDLFKRSMKVPVIKPKKGKCPVFPYLPEPVGTGGILKSSVISDLGVIQVDYKNGVRLNLKQTDFKADEISVKLLFGRGRSAEPRNLPGLSELSEMVINESGLGGLDKDELEQALAGKNTYVSFGIGESSFYFQGKTIKKEVSLLFELLYAHVADPGFREDAYSFAMEKFKQGYASASHNIDGGMPLYGTRFLAGGDGRFGVPLLGEFSRLTLKNVKSWIKPPLNHDVIEISVVGDFDPEEIKKKVSQYFGTLKKRDGSGDVKLEESIDFPEGESKEIFIDTKIQKALLVAAYSTEDIWNISRTRRLSILAKIFSNRLMSTIREKQSITYSPFAFNLPSKAYKDYGLFQIFVHCKPDMVNIIKKEVAKIATDIALNGVRDEELKLAINPVVTGIKDMMETNDYWLGRVLSGSMGHPKQLDWSRTIMKDYASITQEEVSLLAEKYLKIDKQATVVVKPKIIP